LIEDHHDQAQDMPPDASQQGTEAAPSGRPQAQPVFLLQPVRGWFEYTQLVVSILTLLALVVYTSFTGTQTRLNRRAIRVSEQALRASEQALQVSERAYLHVGRLAANLYKARIDMSFFNSGRHPATRATVRIETLRALVANDQITQVVHSHRQTFGGDRTEVPPGTAGPGIGYWGMTVPLPELTRSDIEAIRSGQQRLSIAGLIEHDDGFGTPQKTSFCYHYDPDPTIQWNRCPVVTFEDLQKMEPTQPKQP